MGEAWIDAMNDAGEQILKPGNAGARIGANEYVVGIIGMGDMGKMYTRRLSEASYT